MHHLSIDLETYSSVPLAKAGAQKYIQSPDFEILLFAFSLDGAPVEIIDLARGERLPPWLVQAITSPEYIKHAYNAPFEWGCLSKYLGTLPPSQWRCTMFHGLYCGYTAGLDATGKALGLPQDKQKLNTGKALIRYFCIPCKPTKANGQRTRNLPQHDPAKWELFKEYCKQDVVTEMEIERRLSAFMPPDWVQKQWETDLIINARGVAVDLELVTGALYLGDTVRQNLTAEAVRLSGLSNPNSVAQLSAWLQEEIGEELADLRKDTVARLLGRDDNSAQVSRMLEIRQELGKTSTKKYDAIEAAVCEDGRVRGLLQFYGANRTGRWAGRLVQVQNLPRTYTEPLDLARELVKDRKLDALRLIYDTYNSTSGYVTSETRTVDNNALPVITSSTASGSDLGTKETGFDLTYTVNDADKDTVTVKEYLDDVLKRTYTATLGQSNTVQCVTAANWQKVLNGAHTIKVVANDGKADSAPYTVTFTKAVYEASITLAAPMDADDLITVMVLNVLGSIPADADLEVLVTNNAKDTEPVWEDATQDVKNGNNHVFTNQTATNGFAFNFKVNVSRGSSSTGGYITSIGGAFQ